MRFLASEIKMGRASAKPITSDFLIPEGVKLKAISALKVSSLLGATIPRQLPILLPYAIHNARAFCETFMSC